jgi:hypothetical protein
VIVTVAPGRVRLRPIALPVEHGAWGFLLEPIVLGLAVAWSIRGLALAIAAIALFLVRQPLKVWWSDVAASRRQPRTGIALAIAVAYGAVAAGGLALAFFASLDAALPLAMALPFVAAMLWFDARGRSRALAAELLGPVALASVGASIVMLGGWSVARGAAVWALLSLRAVPSVLYVRSRLRLEHGRDPILAIPLIAHALAILPVLWLVRVGLVPGLVAPLYPLLLLRCWAGLSSLRRRFGAKSVGFSEVRWGAISVAWLALAFLFA